MPRQKRILPLEGFLHCIARANNHRKLFRRETDFKFYYHCLLKLKKEERIKIHHYCFMPTHVHFLMWIEKISRFARLFKRLNLRYTYFYNRKYSYTGNLWQNRPKSFIIDSDSYMLQCGKYIELNPVRAGIAVLPEEYPYSSYGYYAFGRKDELVDENPFFEDLADTNQKRRLVYQNMILAEIRKKENLVFTDFVIHCEQISYK